jgi:chromate transporter
VTTQKDDTENCLQKFSSTQYLKDVFLCSLVAFGGPEAHLGVFLDRLGAKEKIPIRESTSRMDGTM